MKNTQIIKLSRKELIDKMKEVPQRNGFDFFYKGASELIKHLGFEAENSMQRFALLTFLSMFILTLEEETMDEEQFPCDLALFFMLGTLEEFFLLEDGEHFGFRVADIPEIISFYLRLEKNLTYYNKISTFSE